MKQETKPLIRRETCIAAGVLESTNEFSLTANATSTSNTTARVPLHDACERAPAWIGFRRWARVAIWAAVGVTLFGAVVRITGSGAGCGQHWPTCRGALLLVPATLETAIEYTHRMTSGLLAAVVIVLLIRALGTFPRRHPVRFWCACSTLFIGVEAAVGMLLVRLALVGSDASVARVAVMPVHLVSTLLLLCSMTLSAFFSQPASGRHPRNARAAALVSGGMLGFLLIAASGAVTALGDTVWPVHASAHLSSLAGEHAQALGFLERSRAVHPFLAVILILSLMLLPRVSGRGSPLVERLARLSVVLLLLQGGIGAMNVFLSAPAILQVFHLFVTCVIWITLVSLAAELWSPRAIERGSSQAEPPSPVQADSSPQGGRQQNSAS